MKYNRRWLFLWGLKIAIIKKLHQLCCLLFSVVSLGQNAKALYTDKPIEIDGFIEDTWNKAPESSPFWEYFPTDTLVAKEQTQVKILFDDVNLYVLINAEAEDKNFISSSLRRDFSSRNNDSVTLVLDTNDGTTAFLFGTNAEGVQEKRWFLMGV